MSDLAFGCEKLSGGKMESNCVPCAHPHLVGFVCMTLFGLILALWFEAWPGVDTRRLLSRSSPIIVTATMCLWTMGVCPFSDYGDNWAIVPVLFAPLIVMCAHTRLAFVDSLKPTAFWSYFGAHAFAFSFIWIVCLMLISKDGL